MRNLFVTLVLFLAISEPYRDRKPDLALFNCWRATRRNERRLLMQWSGQSGEKTVLSSTLRLDLVKVVRSI